MRHWTPEERLKQSKLIKQQKPYNFSTGPRTPEGKAKVRNNALRHGKYSEEIRNMAKEVAEVKRQFRQLIRSLFSFNLQ